MTRSDLFSTKRLRMLTQREVEVGQVFNLEALCLLDPETKVFPILDQLKSSQVLSAQ